MSVTRYVSVRHKFVISICHRIGTSRMLAAISCNGNLQISERYESTWTARRLLEEQLVVMIQSYHEDTPENLCYLYLGILCSDTVSDVIVSECQAGAMRR